MKYAIALLLLFPLTCFGGSYMLLPIDEVHDGDTIKTHVAEYRLPSPLNLLSIRVRGIDTPEMPAASYAETGKLGRAKCVKEAEMALQAKREVEMLIEKLHATTMKVENFEWDKFGGRVLGDISIGGIDVAQLLMSKGLAIQYFGEAKTHDWCQ